MKTQLEDGPASNVINRAAASRGLRVLKQVHQEITTMDTLTEDVSRADLDSEMRVLTPEDITGRDLEAGDEVELLRNR